MKLGMQHARQVAKALEARGMVRTLICPDCQQEVEPAAWSVHRKQLCAGRLAAARVTTSKED